MKLKCPDGSINIGAEEYTADKDGFVSISDPVHIAAALANGCTEGKPAPVTTGAPATNNKGE